MGMDNSSMAAAALFDLKNEQIQQQPISGELVDHSATANNKLQEGVSNQAVASEAAQFQGDGKRNLIESKRGYEV